MATEYGLFKQVKCSFVGNPHLLKYDGACTSDMLSLSADLCCISDFCNEFC